MNFGRDSNENGLAILRLVAILVYTFFNVSKKNEGQSYAEILQHNLLCESARSVTFELMSLIVERSVQLHDPSSSFLLPGILVFLEWLACCPDFAACTNDDKKPIAAKSSFWKNSIALLNKLLASRLVTVDDDGDETCFTNMARYDEGETESRLALSEDFELRGFSPILPAQNILDFSRKQSTGVGGSTKEKRTRVKRVISAGRALASVAMVDRKSVSFDSKAKRFVIGVQPQVSDNNKPNSYMGIAKSPSTEQVVTVSSVNSMITRENVQQLCEGDDDDEEIVFKPALVEKKKIDAAIESTWNFPEDSKQERSTPPVSSSVHYPQVTTSERIPTFGNVAPQHFPVRDLPNSSSWLVEQQQQASLLDGMNRLRFTENGHEMNSEMKGSMRFPVTGSRMPPQPPASFMDPALVYSDYRRGPEVMISSKMDYAAFPENPPDNMGVKQPSFSSTAFKSQAGRPVRHLGPPPGFSHVPPKHVSMPMSSNGSLAVDDYSWLDGYHMPPSANSMGPNPGSNNNVLSHMNSSNGNIGMPFPGMQGSAVQFQGGNLKSYSDYQPFQNLNHNNIGHNKLLEQQHAMTGNLHQFTPQPEQYQGQSPWTGQYRV